LLEVLIERHFNVYFYGIHIKTEIKFWNGIISSIYQKKFVLKIAVVWDVTPCSLVETNRLITGTCFLIITVDSTKLMTEIAGLSEAVVQIPPNYMMPHPRRQKSS
jgi:hypothetical protein